jgi:hypothetical protein
MMEKVWQERPEFRRFAVNSIEANGQQSRQSRLFPFVPAADGTRLGGVHGNSRYIVSP